MGSIKQTLEQIVEQASAENVEERLDRIIEVAKRTYPPHGSEQPYLPVEGLGEVARGVICAEIEEELGLIIPSHMMDVMQRPRDFKDFVEKTRSR